MGTYELYRQSTIGKCLTDTLNAMVVDETISPELAIQVLLQFDKSIVEALENRVRRKVSIKGKIDFNYCSHVWKFIIQDAVIKSEEFQETVSGRVKLVACESNLFP